MTKAFDQAIERYGRWLIKWRWAVVAMTLVAAFGLASGARFLGFASDYRVFFSKENPQLTSFESLQDIYTKNDNILFVVAPKDGEVFTPQALAAVENLTDEAWKLPFAIRVDAVTNFQRTQADGDDLMVGDLVYQPDRRSAEEIADARAFAVADPILVHRTISPSGHVTGVNVTLQMPGESINEVPTAVAAARLLADSIRTAHPGIDIRLTGMAPLNNAFAESSQSDMKSLVPMMFLVIVITMWVLLRSITGTLGAVAVIGLSAASAMGFAGWLGFRITPPSASAPTMILTLAVADSIHLLVTLLQQMRAGQSKASALVESLRLNFTPILLTSVTTAIGFLSMNFSDSPPFRDLGNITAIGVMAAFVYSVSFLPALVAILPVRVKVQEGPASPFMDRLGAWVVSTRRPLLWASSIAVLAISAFIARNDLNDQFVQYFDERVTFRNDTDFAIENLTGIYQVEFSLDSGETNGIAEPDYLATLDRFEAWYKEQPVVLHVSSFSETMKRVNRSMHGDDDSWYRIPASRELAAQYLLLYEMSLPFGLDLNNQINVDKSSTRFTVTLEDASARELRDIAKAGEVWLADNAPEHMWSAGSSASVMFAHISERNIRSMVGGTLLAIVLISTILIFALRSLKFGFLSLLPNLIPAALAFGVWGMVVAQVNVGLTIVMGMTLGIVVDDTIHFLSKYLRARREKRLDSAGAVRYAFSSVGTALVVTTIVLVAGFMVLAQSSFDVNGGMAKLSAIAIAFALIADMLLLPPVLMALEPPEGETVAAADVGVEPAEAGA